MKNKHIRKDVIVLVGSTGCGKTSLFNYMYSKGYLGIPTYTTRDLRFNEGSDTKHMTKILFKHAKEWESIQEYGFAYPFGVEQYYCTLKKDWGETTWIKNNKLEKEICISKCGSPRVVVLDPVRIAYINKHCSHLRKRMYIVYLDLDKDTILERLVNRGDDVIEINRRLDAEAISRKDFTDWDLKITDYDFPTNAYAQIVDNFVRE